MVFFSSLSLCFLGGANSCCCVPPDTGSSQTFHDGVGKAQIPNFAVLLADLFNLEELKTKDAQGVIGFHKFGKQWRELSDVLAGQSHSYQTLAVTESRKIRRLFDTATVITSEDAMYDKSYSFEPRLTAQVAAR